MLALEDDLGSSGREWWSKGSRPEGAGCPGTERRGQEVVPSTTKMPGTWCTYSKYFLNKEMINVNPESLSFWPKRQGFPVGKGDFIDSNDRVLANWNNFSNDP